MTLIFKKSFTRMLMEECGLFISLLGFLFLLSLSPEDLTPTYAKALPYNRLFVLAVALYYFFRVVVWLFRSKTLTVDLERMVISIKNKEIPVTGCSVTIILKRRNDEMFYRLEFRPREYFVKYKTPAGYKTGVPYKDIVAYLDEKGIQSSVSYVPYFVEFNKDKWY